MKKKTAKTKTSKYKKYVPCQKYNMQVGDTIWDRPVKDVVAVIEAVLLVLRNPEDSSLAIYTSFKPE